MDLVADAGMLADTAGWLPVATALVGGGIATGSTMLALHVGRAHEVRDEHRRWVRQLRFKTYVTFLRQEQELSRQEREVMQLVLADAPESDIENAKELLREEQHRMVAVQSEALMAAAERVVGAIEDLCFGARPITQPLILARHETCDVDTLVDAVDELHDRRARLYEVMRKALGLV